MYKNKLIGYARDTLVRSSLRFLNPSQKPVTSFYRDLARSFRIFKAALTDAQLSSRCSLGDEGMTPMLIEWLT